MSQPKGVPNLSPFRYPGGKTWLVPHTRLWLAGQPTRPELLVEAFAGGASVGLDALSSNRVERLLLVEFDPAIAAVWRVLADGQGPALAEAIAAFDCRRENVLALLSTPAPDELGRALQTIVRNRTSFGGIISAPVRLLVNGDRGLGVAARWNPATLARRIEAIHALRDRLEFVEGDGLAAIAVHAGEANTHFFLDPPYSSGGKNAGHSLYGAGSLDHARLFELAASVAGNFLLTYDDAVNPLALAARHGFAVERVPMHTNRHVKRAELLITRAPALELAPERSLLGIA
jgi:DNA adenine methylase